MKLGMNIQHPTFNIQRRIAAPRGTIGCWMLNVECWMFLALIFSAMTAFAQVDTNDLPALAPARSELPPTFFERRELTPAYWSQPCTIIMVGGIVSIVLAGAICILFVPIKPMVLPPETVARQALEKLQNQPEGGKILSEVSQILRRYVSVAFELPAAELTTAEFCTALAANEQIGTEAATSISSFLRECDERKFSPAVRSSAFTRPGPPEGGTPNLLPPINTATRALELIALAESRCLRSAPVPGAAMSQAQEAAANQQTQPSSDVAASGDGRTPR
jgi:hypothetical protein